jgi:hypothetical protein
VTVRHASSQSYFLSRIGLTVCSLGARQSRGWGGPSTGLVAAFIDVLVSVIIGELVSSLRRAAWALRVVVGLLTLDRRCTLSPCHRNIR